MTSLPTVGFIGLGTMGLPMALNVRRGGHTMRVHDLNPDAVRQAVEAGAGACATVAELAAASDVIITMLPDAPDVEATALGQSGIESAARPGTLYIDMSTIDPGTSRRVGARLQGRGLRMLDSPVARGPENARNGTLALMVGGAAEDLAQAEPILRLMADTITHCGPLGNGTAMKLVNNFLSGGIVSTIAEAMAIGMKAGLPLDLMVRVSGGTGTNNAWLHRLMPGKAFRGDYSLGFTSRLALKDHRLARRMATELGVRLTLGEAVLTLLEETAERYPREDFTSLLRVLGERAGVEIRFTEEPATA